MVVGIGGLLAVVPKGTRTWLTDLMAIFGNFAMIATLIGIVLDRKDSEERARQAEVAQSVQATSDGWLYIEELFMNNTEDLQHLYYEINRELGFPRPPTFDEPRTTEQANRQFHMIMYLIQVIQNVYMLENLKKVLAEGRHSGWVTVFQMWFRSKLVRDTWTVISPIYNEEFQGFVRDHLMPPPPPPQ
jgi:hypothetical protein